MLKGAGAGALVVAIDALLPPSAFSKSQASGGSRRLSSVYVRLRDGTRLAVDIWLPQGLSNGRVGTILEPTRYTRSWQRESTRIEDDDNYDVASLINRAGLAFVIADGRGSGASFGARRGELSEVEVRDFGEIIDWIAAQSFSNGRVGAMGISYPGVLTEHLARLRRPALKAIAPRFSYYDVYADLCVPNGIYMRTFMRGWAVAMGKADRVPSILCREAKREGEMSCDAYAAKLPQPKAVEGPRGLELLRAAQQEHAANLSFPESVEVDRLYFKDDRNAVVFWRGMSPEGHASELEAAATPYYVQASWLDRGSASGALRRFQRQGNTQIVEIGPWSHGSGGYITDTLAGENGARSRTLDEQMTPALSFFVDHLSSGAKPALPGKRLRYYVMGEASWHETRSWPPPAARTQKLHLNDGAELRAVPPTSRGDVTVLVKESQSTGLTGRWGAAWRGGPVRFDRKAQTEGLTSFRTLPLTQDLRLIGHVRCSLELIVNQPDGTLFAYLDALAPDGQVHYLSEGALRFIHRATPRSFARRDALPVVPGEPFRLQFEMQPMAARIKAGWRLQLTLADRDIDNFDRYDSGLAPEIGVRFAPEEGSWLELPIVD